VPRPYGAWKFRPAPQPHRSRMLLRPERTHRGFYAEQRTRLADDRGGAQRRRHRWHQARRPQHVGSTGRPADRDKQSPRKLLREAGRKIASSTEIRSTPTPDDIQRILRVMAAYGYWSASPEEHAAATGPVRGT